MRLPHLQHCQDRVIHLADASSHGVANLQIRSLSNRLPSANHGSSAKANLPKIVHSTSNPTRMYENSLDSAISADVQATKCKSVGLNHRKPAEVTSLVARLHNLPTEWDQDHLIRETSEGVNLED